MYSEHQLNIDVFDIKCHMILLIEMQYNFFTKEIKALLDLLGVYEIAPHTEFFTWLGHLICNNEIHPILTEICMDVAFWFANLDEDGKFNE